jgi:hypothetical protein
MQRMLDIILGRVHEVPAIPVCPDHMLEMQLRGKLGRPARFTDQTEEEYTLVYFCPEENCDHTETRDQVRTQIPVPNEPPERPKFARVDDRDR